MGEAGVDGKIILKMGIQEIVCDVANCIKLAQNGVCWWNFMNMVTEHWFF
jgi:hypothetical protein